MADICHVQLPKTIWSGIIIAIGKIVLVVYIEFSSLGDSKNLMRTGSLLILIMKVNKGHHKMWSEVSNQHYIGLNWTH